MELLDEKEMRRSLFVAHHGSLAYILTDSLGKEK